MPNDTTATSTDDAANAAALAAALAGEVESDDTDGDVDASSAGATDADKAAETGGDKGTDNGDTSATDNAELEALKAQIETIKAESRKWEERSKKNFEELRDLKRAGMTDEERAAAEKADVATETSEALERAEKAEAALLRKTIAVDLSLSKENAAVLDGITGDEKALRAVAAILATNQKTADEKPAPKKGVVQTQGAQTDTGKRSLGDMFEEAMGEAGLF